MLNSKLTGLSLFIAFSVLLFDFFISSAAAIPFRLLYDLSFALVMAVFGYTSMMLLTQKTCSWQGLTFVLPKHAYVVPIILNANAAFSTIWLTAPNIGFLNPNVLFQGLSTLLPLANFLLVMAANAVLIYINVYGTKLRLYKLAAFTLAVIAVETCLSIYAFELFGVEGICWSLVLFHLFFIGLAVGSRSKFKSVQTSLLIASSDVLLLCVSLAVFLFVFVPFGLYNLYSDNAVVVGNALSIVNRGSLQPYYAADFHYSPIMGFVSVLFAYSTGLDNLLLCTNLPFLAASLLLPFVTYHFLKSFVTDDSRTAVIGALCVALLDGLAVILLPLYAGNITNLIINWRISPLTQSLYYSNISQLWLTPYKSFAAVTAIAACAVLEKRSAVSYVLGGALFFLSFSNPRYSIITIALLVLLYGLRRIDARGIVLFSLSAVFLGAITLPVHAYKQLLAFSVALHSRGLIGDAIHNQFNLFLNVVVSYDFLPAVIFAVSLTLMGAVAYRFSANTKPDQPRSLLIHGFLRGFDGLTKRFTLWFERFDAFFALAILGLAIYVAVNAYFPSNFLLLKENLFFSTLNNIVLRYHILAFLLICSLLIFRFKRRLLLSLTVVVAVLFLSALTGSTTIIPIVYVALAIPFFDLVVKRRRLLSALVLAFVFLGLFSSTFYCATVTSQTREEYSDVPHVVNLLLKRSAGEPVYCPSYYTYYADRVLKMGHLTLSSDNNCTLQIIDKNYVSDDSLASSLKQNNSTVLYNGDRFILLEKTP